MLLSAWIGLNAADVLLTALSLAMGAVELNPYLAAIAANLSPEQMLTVKLLLAVAVGGAVYQRGARNMLRSLNWLMVGVVPYNALIITYAL